MIDVVIEFSLEATRTLDTLGSTSQLMTVDGLGVLQTNKVTSAGMKQG